MANDKFNPRPEDKFSFGLWTVGNRGRDPFGEAVRPTIPPNDIVALLAEVGAWGVNLHDNDLVPIDATAAERDRIVRDFKAACKQHGIVVPMATVNLFYDPVFRDGAFTANDPAVRGVRGEREPRPAPDRLDFWSRQFREADAGEAVRAVAASELGVPPASAACQALTERAGDWGGGMGIEVVAILLETVTEAGGKLVPQLRTPKMMGFELQRIAKER